ncbi:MAG: ABC transporter substrate-binding protein [SAR202 cluster bacterium]|nr:ABC transporter substrate-binding protein [SAR202 cluster bacterium]|tara:strand:- start:2343 stop:4133 length:1791 start_codon:yes stop_codon:yes gene_type:complete
MHLPSYLITAQFALKRTYRKLMNNILAPITKLAFVVITIFALGCNSDAILTTVTSDDIYPKENRPINFHENAENAQRGNILTLANRGDPPAGFDPMRTSSIALHHIGGSIFGPGNLVRRCRTNMYLICPDLAKNWRATQDFKEWTFSIRHDVTWHDGTPFTAQDVKFWFDLATGNTNSATAIRAPAYFKGELGRIEKTEVLEFNRVRITLKDRSPHFLGVLANPRLKFAHPTHLMENRIKNGALGLSPLDIGLIGTGPFKFVSYAPGSLIQVRRNNDYWEKDALANRLPYLDGIDFVIMTNPTSMDAAIRTGRIDGGARGEGHYLSVERKKGYDNDSKSNVYYGRMQGGLFRLAFNVLRPGPWQDQRVRTAISLWIDKEASIPSALGGFGYISPILSPSNPFTSSDFQTWPRFNPELKMKNRITAKDLMAQAGYEDGFTMTHLCRGRIAIRCEFLQAQLAGLNINLKLDIVDEGSWNRSRIALDHDSQQGSFFTTPVPEGTESVFGRYSANPDAYAKHEDETIQALYQRMRSTSSHTERVALWRTLERYLILEQVYVVPIAGTIQIVPFRSSVKGLPIPPEDGHTHTDFSTTWLSE